MSIRMNRVRQFALSVALVGLVGAAAQAQDADYKAKLATPGVITIATTGNAPPITQTQADGSLTGFDVELCRLVAKNLGLGANFVRVDFAATIPGLTAGRFDMICSSTARTPQRLNSPDLFMTSATLENYSTLLVRANNTDIKAVGDIAGKRVGTVRGGQEAKLITDDFGAKVELVTYPGIAEEILDLRNGRIDAVAINYVTAASTVRTNPALKVITPGFVKDGVSPYQYALIVSRSQKALFDAVEAEIAKLKASGALDNLRKQWVSAD